MNSSRMLPLYCVIISLSFFGHVKSRPSSSTGASENRELPEPHHQNPVLYDYYEEPQPELFEYEQPPIYEDYSPIPLYHHSVPDRVVNQPPMWENHPSSVQNKLSRHVPQNIANTHHLDYDYPSNQHNLQEWSQYPVYSSPRQPSHQQDNFQRERMPLNPARQIFGRGQPRDYELVWQQDAC